MFFVCNNNHQFKAWTKYFLRSYKDDKDWHIFVDLICLDMKEKTLLLLNALHDINK
jgi:hypothetical protein